MDDSGGDKGFKAGMSQRGKSMGDLRPRRSSAEFGRKFLRPGMMGAMRGKSTTSLLSTDPAKASNFDDLFGRVSSDVSEYSSIETAGPKKKPSGASAFDDFFGGDAKP
eukprot:CAMPEP_0184326646 /NCGR_PEP_ID=MMETSP1049-20130417/142671_1 /TAXON_ID=77928 /ORGANISM="Proteomonas sulcata, Strain CCMP704" /LENGTH=107 /DNA_ID=CAMNT_0026648849 /DNA_START=323 /DNA_END=646 /DNA_ORIENTATION=-